MIGDIGYWTISSSAVTTPDDPHVNSQHGRVDTRGKRDLRPVRVC